MNNNNNDIFFLIEDTVVQNNQTNQENIQKMLDEINDVHCVNENTVSVFSNDFLFYDNYRYTYYETLNIKDLFKILQYYDILKTNKISMKKKVDIIHMIVLFENEPDNYKIVQQRLKMWENIIELTNDPKMRKYLLWN